MDRVGPEEHHEVLKVPQTQRVARRHQGLGRTLRGPQRHGRDVHGVPPRRPRHGRGRRGRRHSRLETNRSRQPWPWPHKQPAATGAIRAPRRRMSIGRPAGRPIWYSLSSHINDQSGLGDDGTNKSHRNYRFLGAECISCFNNHRVVVVFTRMFTRDIRPCTMQDA